MVAGRSEPASRAAVLFAQDVRQFFLHDLDDLLDGRDGLKHIFADGAVADALLEITHHAEIDVGLQGGRGEPRAAPPQRPPR